MSKDFNTLGDVGYPDFTLTLYLLSSCFFLHVNILFSYWHRSLKRSKLSLHIGVVVRVQP
jgi:hypothetical protein